ncbi:hypothetical protein ILUMI_03767, partial [Ignelater luminosus]
MNRREHRGQILTKEELQRIEESFLESEDEHEDDDEDLEPENNSNNSQTPQDRFTLDKAHPKSLSWMRANLEQNLNSAVSKADETLSKEVMKLSTPYDFL